VKWAKVYVLLQVINCILEAIETAFLAPLPRCMSLIWGLGWKQLLFIIKDRLVSMPTFMNIELCLHCVQVTCVTLGQLSLGSLVTNQNWTQLAWSLRGSTAWLIVWYMC